LPARAAFDLVLEEGKGQRQRKTSSVRSVSRVAERVILNRLKVLISITTGFCQRERYIQGRGDAGKKRRPNGGAVDASVTVETK